MKRVLLIALLLPACLTGEQSFVGRRIQDLCDTAYYICSVPAGCVLDQEHYVEGAFPGVRRVAIETDEPNTPVQVRIYFSVMLSPGSELLAQMYEADCSLETLTHRALVTDVDVFEEAGDDRLLVFDFVAEQEGEHLVELYSDASADYLLVVNVGQP